LRVLHTASLIILTALFIVLFDNFSFFKEVLKIYPLNDTNITFLLSLGIILYALLVIIFTLIASKYTLKPTLIFILIVSAGINYFMQSYNIVVDDTMIENILQTDMKESIDLFSSKLLIYLFAFGLLPAWIIYRVPIDYHSFKREFLGRIKLILIHLTLIVVLLLSFSKFYTSFFREHKSLRLYTNPLTTIYHSVAYIYNQLEDRDVALKPIGLDAHIKPHKKRKIVIMVVGEAARADHFSLNGYTKETNPLLKKEDIVNFTQMYSCGTTTAVSVPCMFSIYDRDEYDSKKGRYTQNVLDILSYAGVEVLWRDNNSDSKGVAERVTYESYKSPKNNTICDVECRDEGMLVGLDRVIEKSDKDILIVLHQMGNHGPAYYKRYPQSFKKFMPICETNQLEECSVEEINNAYDNAILYTDYFLSKVIHFLRRYETVADTAMIYMADHGESLGEHGLYLHGLPYFMAPDAQKHVASLMWFGKDFPIDRGELKAKALQEYSQDNLFSTLLGVFDVKSRVYSQEMDILANSRR